MRHLAHELRNTLSATTGWVHVLNHAAGPTEIAKAVEAIERNLRWHGALTEDLVDAAMIAVGGPLSTKAPAKVEAVLEQSQSDVAVLAQRREVRIERGKAAAGLAAQIEPDRLRRMVSTLLRVVVEAAPRSSGVSLAATSLDGNVDIRIEGSPSSSSAVEIPTGVRLVAILAERHGGRLEALGGDDGGPPTAFALRLPRLQA